MACMEGRENWNMILSYKIWTTHNIYFTSYLSVCGSLIMMSATIVCEIKMHISNWSDTKYKCYLHTLCFK